MKISKTQFKNLMRCDRFAALNEIYHDKEKAIVSISEDVELEDLMSLENEQYKNDIIDQMYDDETDEDLIYKENPQMDMMMPYYNELEMIVGKVIAKKFKGKTIYDLDTFNQKRFSYLKNGFNFYCFLDGYQEDESTIRIFETKATTSKKFASEDFAYLKRFEGDSKDTRLDFFIKNDQDVLVPREDLQEVEGDYYKKEKQLFDRFNKRGKYVYDLAYQRYVFEKTYRTEKKVEYYLVILNHEYIHDGKVNEKNNPVYPDDIIKFYNLTSLTKKMMTMIDEDTDLVIERINRMDARETNLGKFCERKKNTECPFFDICYKSFPEKNSVFIYKGRHFGFVEKNGVKHELYELINEGARHALDIPLEYMNRKNNEIQRNVVENKVPYYNYQKIRKGIGALRYPLYHLDFESFNAPLPRFKGEKPYSQSLFQFSIHIEREPGVCDKDQDNYYFLAKNHEDIRKELLEAMLEVIKPDGGSVVVYNVSFEKTRLKELAEFYPEHRKAIEDIMDRLFDLLHVVETNGNFYKGLGFSEEEAKEINFYHEDLNGSFSIKKVLPIFSNLTYKGMRVGNGTEAMAAYVKFPVLKGREFEEMYIDLVNYCKQDTWAMVEILRKLREI
ncbi:MAG: DUF2779 domain-containing protein [Acholeplasma sp.]|nr:DUF2779 domain-containing protein [Acholeplasma sp.]